MRKIHQKYTQRFLKACFLNSKDGIRGNKKVLLQQAARIVSNDLPWQVIDDNDIPGHPTAIDDTEDDYSDNDYSDTDNVHLDKASLDIISEYRQTPPTSHSQINTLSAVLMATLECVT